jgi:hypothetical protein
MKKRASLGDIIEIQTKKGLNYAQFSHRYPTGGEIVRLLPGAFKERPLDFKWVETERELYYVCFPLQTAIHRGIFLIVGKAKIPEFCQEFPVLRIAMTGKDGKYGDWWLWDGKKEWRVGNILTEKQKKLSFKEFINDTLMIERIEAGWLPEQET